MRTFLIFWDDYHIERFVGAVRGREALSRAVLEGRLGVFLPPRNAIEEEHLRRIRRPEQAAVFRYQVVVSAIRSAMSYLGTLRERHKTLIVMTQGIVSPGPTGQPFTSSQARVLELPGGLPSRFWDDAPTAVSLARTANHQNVAVHVIDPRGLQAEGTSRGTVFEMLASGSGGLNARIFCDDQAIPLVQEQAP